VQLLTPKHFSDYELIDCGRFEKLERFGEYITIRPEPQAVWEAAMGPAEWEKTAHVRFVTRSSSSGTWKKLKQMPDRWMISYTLAVNELRHTGLSFRLALTSFKHVGIFPEQAVNWDYIAARVQELKKHMETPRVLNLFAYTGGASLAARAAGADITHLDSVKQVVSWSRDNMELSGLKDIRWVVEDAMTFAEREVKRGKRYQGIILDPPAYGHGKDGQKWKLEDQIGEMMELVHRLLDERCFLILNTYSLGFSPLVIENLLQGEKGLQSGELYLPSRTGFKLPLGVFGRFGRGC
jgi:23S rRNA (cytosine1962-C5)-methyltransferase